MRSILRDPGSEVIVGLASFAISFVGIGLALAALNNTTLSNIAFVVSGLFLLVAVYSFIVLSRHHFKIKRYVHKIAEFLNQGREIRKELLLVNKIPQWTEEMQNKVPQWKTSVQQWLNKNLPDYAHEFDLEGSITTLDTLGVNVDAGRAAEHLESRMCNLRDILRNIMM